MRQSFAEYKPHATDFPKRRVYTHAGNVRMVVADDLRGTSDRSPLLSPLVRREQVGATIRLMPLRRALRTARPQRGRIQADGVRRQRWGLAATGRGRTVA